MILDNLGGADFNPWKALSEADASQQAFHLRIEASAPVPGSSLPYRLQTWLAFPTMM